MALSFYAALLLVAVLVHIGVALVALMADPKGRLNWTLTVYLVLMGCSGLAAALILLSQEGVLPTDPARADLVYTHVRTALEWPGSLFVLAVALFVRGGILDDPRRGRPYFVLFAVFAILWAWVFFDRALFYGPGRPDSGLYWYTLFLDDVRYWAVFLPALWVLGRAWVAGSGPLDGTVAKWLFVAFAIGPVNGAGAMLLSYPRSVLIRIGTADVITMTKYAVHTIGTVALVLLVVAVLWTAHRQRRRVREAAVWLAAASVIGLVVRLWPDALGFGEAGIVGLFQNFGSLAYLLLRPLLIGYAMLVHGFLDVTARVRQGLVTGLLLLTAGLSYFPIVEGVRTFSRFEPETAVPLATGVGLAVVLVIVYIVQVYNQRANAATMDTLLTEDSRQLDARRRMLYRGALQLALAGGVSLTPTKEKELQATRERLGISADEHDSMLMEVVSATTDRTRRRSVAPGTVLFGRYRVEEVLGEGGSGRTYRCQDTTLDRTVAVKQIDTAGDAATRRRALREARTLAKVQDAHVVGIHDVLESDGDVYLVMELARGGPLAARLGDGPLAPENARRVLDGVLAGLQALHDAGVVHRDLKPSNVLLDPDRGAMVADLGIAHADVDVTMTRFRQAGTPVYMAPEQLLDQDVDARTDLYAAAALLYEMMTGETYVRRATDEGVLVEEAIVSRPPPELPTRAPAWARRFVTAGLRKDPANRPSDCCAARMLIDGPRPGTA